MPASHTRPTTPEFVLGVLLAILAICAIGPVPALVPAVALALATPVLWRVDIEERRLPNALVAPCGLLAGGALATTGFIEAAWPVGPVVAAAVSGAFFLVLSVGGGMGMGDVKLAVVLATVLALIRVDAVVAAAIIAFVLGGMAALVVRLRSRQRSIPFGPFLLVGFWVALVLAA